MSQTIVTATPEWYQEMLDTHEFVVLAFYRGDWCPYCKAFLCRFEKLVEEISSRGGYLAAICAQNEEVAKKTQKNWKLSFDVKSDSSTEFAQFLNEQKLFKPKLAITTTKLDPHTWMYDHGFIQPALLFINKERVLYQWAIQPSIMNLGGASDRPAPEEVWESVKASLNGEEVKPPQTKLGLISSFFY